MGCRKCGHPMSVKIKKILNKWKKTIVDIHLFLGQQCDVIHFKWSTKTWPESIYAVLSVWDYFSETHSHSKTGEKNHAAIVFEAHIFFVCLHDHIYYLNNSTSGGYIVSICTWIVSACLLSQGTPHTAVLFCMPLWKCLAVYSVSWFNLMVCCVATTPSCFFNLRLGSFELK